MVDLDGYSRSRTNDNVCYGQLIDILFSYVPTNGKNLKHLTVFRIKSNGDISREWVTDNESYQKVLLRAYTLKLFIQISIDDCAQDGKYFKEFEIMLKPDSL